MGADTVKIYCPRCQSVYHPPPVRSRSSHHGPGPATGAGSGAVDGAAFGTTFPHLFLMTFNNLVPDPLDSKSKYVPRVFGFRVHHSARQRPSTAGSTGGLPSSMAVPQGNVGRRHGGGGSHALSASRSGAGGRAAAAGPSSPPAEAGLPAVPADGGLGQQNGKGEGRTESRADPEAQPYGTRRTTGRRRRRIEERIQRRCQKSGGQGHRRFGYRRRKQQRRRRRGRWRQKSINRLRCRIGREEKGEEYR